MAMLFPDSVDAPVPVDAESPAYMTPGGVIYPEDLPGAAGEVPAGVIYPDDPPARDLPLPDQTSEPGYAEDWPAAQTMSASDMEWDGIALEGNVLAGMEIEGRPLDGMAWNLGTLGNPFVPAEPELPDAMTPGDPVIPMHLFT
jgi:hypothetical protein